MGRKAKKPVQVVSPVSSKKQLLRIDGVRQFFGGISADSFEKMRNDPENEFPSPLQILGGTPLWSVEQLEKFVAREEKKVERLAV